MRDRSSIRNEARSGLYTSKNFTAQRAEALAFSMLYQNIGNDPVFMASTNCFSGASSFLHSTSRAHILLKWHLRKNPTQNILTPARDAYRMGYDIITRKQAKAVDG
jgi:hypothetical protein